MCKAWCVRAIGKPPSRRTRSAALMYAMLAGPGAALGLVMRGAHG